MNFVRKIREWCWARQRAIDLQILWPACKEQARDLDQAKAAFAVHAFEAPCWISFYGESRLIDLIGDLQ